MTFVLLGACLCFAAAAASAVRTASSRRALRASLDRAAGHTAPPPELPLALGGRTLPLAGRFASVALAVRPGVGREDVALRLAGAGLAGRVSADAFLAAQGLCLVVSLALAVVAGASGSVGSAVALALVGVGFSVLLPDRVVAALAARRRTRLLAELPGALDLLCVSVEAGLAFDAALARIAGAVEGPLADEFAVMLSEIRVGESRTVALQRLSDRVGAPEVTSFARAVTRAEQLGTSVAQTLRVQAADARARRQVAAEEQAAKAPVKMLFPTVFFIFPAMFVVVLGPALISLRGFLG